VCIHEEGSGGGKENIAGKGSMGDDDNNNTIAWLDRLLLRE
jgi:hypothetical protein